jgi:hypothetical protein
LKVKAKSDPNYGKGWSLINILNGLLFLAVAYATLTLTIFFGFLSVGDSERSVSIYIYILGWLGVVMLLLGSLGFWLVIPAFQKWWHTKDRWLAWLFLGIAVAIFSIFIFYIRE